MADAKSKSDKARMLESIAVGLARYKLIAEEATRRVHGSGGSYDGASMCMVCHHRRYLVTFRRCNLCMRLACEHCYKQCMKCEVYYCKGCNRCITCRPKEETFDGICTVHPHGIGGDDRKHCATCTAQTITDKLQAAFNSNQRMILGRPSIRISIGKPVVDVGFYMLVPVNKDMLHFVPLSRGIIQLRHSSRSTTITTTTTTTTATTSALLKKRKKTK
jgi:hypothetical protein